MQLVIVESPTKAKTISRFLGKGYVVKSSFGHVRDLPKKEMGIDIEHNFKPRYIIPPKARKVIKELKGSMSKAGSVILASDEDREGEAIAWHLTQALGLGDGRRKPELEGKKVQRIVFHEITRQAIVKALANPREINTHLVDAQQARRVLDRLVGYELSPFLWQKVRYGLSAGRVQSVALRLVVEREREIEAFKPAEYWSIEADFAQEGIIHKPDKPSKFHAKLFKIGDKTLDKLEIKDEKSAKGILDEIKHGDYKVFDVQTKEVRRTPAPAFTTSTLQQEASRKLNMSAKQTMQTAQKLYETGFITYMRTDSVNLAESAILQARKAIKDMYGAKYVSSAPRRYKVKAKGAQEAHEAIRPTDFSALPANLAKLDSYQKKLYDLIWKRAIATQMEQAIFDQTIIDVATGKYIFRATGQVVRFDGFIKVYTEGKDNGNGRNNLSLIGSSEVILPKVKKGEKVIMEKLDKKQHFTEPPARYTDATLVKALEAHAIGRPSTYAPILSTIYERGYVEKDNKRYKPTEIGILVTDILVEHFPEVVDIDFTSHVEEELDDIAQGKLTWTSVIKEFYQPFKQRLEGKKQTVKKIVEMSDIRCEHCGKNMLIKFGRNGKFLACPDPESKITRPLPEEEKEIKALERKTDGEKCPECGSAMKVRRGKFGYFLGCVNYPKCKGIAKIVTKIGFKCPNCGKGEMIERKSRGRGNVFYGCSNYPECKFLINKIPENKEELFDMLEEWKTKATGKSNKAKG